MARHKVNADMVKKRKAQARAASAASRSKRTAIIFSIIGAVIVLWIGYAVFDEVKHPTTTTSTTTEKAQTTNVNLDALNDYMSGLHSN